MNDVDNLENQPTTSTSLSMTDIRQKYLYNKSDSSFIRNKSIDEEILRKKEVVDMNLRSNKRKSINSRDYTLTMIDMDTLQEVKDKNDNEFIHQDLEVSPKKRSKKKKKEKAEKKPRLLMKDAEKISNDVFANMNLQPLTKCMFCLKSFNDKNGKQKCDRVIGSHLIHCSYKLNYDINYVKTQVSVKLQNMLHNRTLMDDAIDINFQRLNNKGRRKKKISSKLEAQSSTSKVISERLDNILRQYSQSETESESDDLNIPFMDSEVAKRYCKKPI